ncbi:MAG: hypothetical protein WBM32_15040 [Crocosphaera sp.]
MPIKGSRLAIADKPPPTMTPETCKARNNFSILLRSLTATQ